MTPVSRPLNLVRSEIVSLFPVEVAKMTIHALMLVLLCGTHCQLTTFNQ